MKAAEPTTAYEAFERSPRTPDLRRNRLPPVSSRKAVAFPWLTLLLLAAAAAALRVAFTAGPLGSDDIVYAERAIDALNGTFSPATYHGATRYGVNLPLAAIIGLFGPSIAAITAFYIACSVAEVALVFVLALRLWDERAACCAGLILATLPLHVGLAGILNPDPWLALVMTASFAAFLFAETSGAKLWYLIAGGLAGLVFWIKEVVLLFALVYVGYAIVQRRLKGEWLLMVASAAAVVLGSCLFCWVVFGDPLMILHNYLTHLAKPAIAEATIFYTSPFYYLNYLFIYAVHTWVLGYLALGGVVLWVVGSRHKAKGGHKTSDGAGLVFVAVWAAGLLLVFSLTPYSLYPLHLIPKQTNYMAMFFAPLALLGGWFLSRLRGPAFIATIMLTLGGSIVLMAAEQADLRVFTANARVAQVFADRHPDAPVLGTTINANLSLLLQLLPPAQPSRQIEWLDDAAKRRAQADASAAYVVVDRQTMDAGTFHQRVGDVPACWQHVERLVPTGMGPGWAMWSQIARGIGLLAAVDPTGIIRAVAERLSRRLTPAPADVYRVPPGCDL